MAGPPGIEHKYFPETLVVIERHTVKDRSEIQAVLKKLAATIPDGLINGPAFCIFWFVTSVQDGFDVQIGYPVSAPFKTKTSSTQLQPPLETLCMVHEGPIEDIHRHYEQLYSYAAELALISDEFRREIYVDENNPQGGKIEIQFIIHNWNKLFMKNLKSVLGCEAAETIMRGSEGLGIGANAGERFEWTKAAIERLDSTANTDQKYEILSHCAHVFPQAQIDKLRLAYVEALANSENSLAAIDAVIDFMDKDPGWGSRPRREGRIIYSKKQPRDPEGYINATTPLEKRRAYCFCPLVRDYLDAGMSPTFCNCSTGWNRRQWEGAIGKPVKIEILQSILRGDDVCEFAIHLPEDL